jgi:hypothetical protein
MGIAVEGRNMEGGVDRQRQRTALQPSNPVLGLRSELFPHRVCGYIIQYKYKSRREAKAIKKT